jgi:hypothetical protein
VVRAIRTRGPVGWDELGSDDRTLGISKLRLAGVYDDRQGHFMLGSPIGGW